MTDTETFAFFLGGLADESFVEIGTSDIDTYSNDPTSALTVELTDHFFWLGTSDGFKAGADGGKKSEFSYGAYVIFDTGTSLLMSPKKLGSWPAKKLLKGRKKKQSSGLWYTTCDNIDSLPSFYLHIQDSWLEIPASSYMIEYPDDPSICIVGIVPNSGDYWLAGDVFLRNYYAVFDDTKGTLTLAARLGSDVKSIVVGDKPSKKFTMWYNPTFQLYFYIALVAVILGVACFLIYWFVFKAPSPK